MKAVILAGGLGTRISEETSVKPKPMVEIGGRPILWHILKIFSAHGINEFVICCGYKGYVIKEYFANYFLHMSDVTFHMRMNSMEVHHKKAEPWEVTLVDTGETTMTGGRLKRVRDYVKNEAFCFTYGDGVADVDITALIAHHKTHGRLGTVTAVQPPGRYGALQFGENAAVSGFQEKPQGDGGWINGGFFVLEPEVIDRIESDATIWEQDPLAAWPRTASSRLFTTPASGSQWTPCAIGCTSRSSGPRPRLLGRCGDAGSRILGWPADAAHRPHRLQGQLAAAVAAAARRPGVDLRPRA